MQSPDVEDWSSCLSFQEPTGHPVGGRSLSDAAARLPAEASPYSLTAPAGAGVHPTLSVRWPALAARPSIHCSTSTRTTTYQPPDRTTIYVSCMATGRWMLDTHLARHTGTRQPSGSPIPAGIVENRPRMTGLCLITTPWRRRNVPESTLPKHAARHQAPSTRTSHPV